MSVLLLNLGEKATTVTLELPISEEADETPRLEFVLTSADGTPQCSSALLNGKLLQAGPGGDLPNVLAEGVRAHGRRVRMPARSFGEGVG